MKVQIRYFAALREALGQGESIELPDGMTLGRLRDWLCERDEDHRAVLARPRPVRCALDRAMSDEATPIHDGAEVAFFPPVTGG